MITTFAALWLKLNLLLLLAFMLWQGSKWLAATCGQALRFNAELKLARCLFAATLLAPLLFLLAERRFGLGTSIPGLTVVAGSLAAGIDGSLASTVSLRDADVSVALIFVVLLGSGLVIQTVQLTRRYRQLARLLAATTPFRRLHTVHIAFSSAVATPFSTRALGMNHIVLPYQLLQSPANLGLAVKHELQHVRNGDLRWVLFMEFLKPLFFWNPAWYLWLNEFHCLQEYACDEALLRKPSVQAQAYGNCLLEVAFHATTAPVWAASNMVPQFASFRSARSQLLRRIVMLESTRKERYSGVRQWAFSGLLLLGLGCSAGAVLSASDEQNLEYLPLTIVQPLYPTAALERQLIGWAQVMFDVDPDGGVSRIAVRDHCVVPREFDATMAVDESGCMLESDVFDAVSRDAIEQFTFKPRIVDGEPVTTQDVQYVFRFTLAEGDTPIRTIMEQYRALQGEQ